MSQQNFLRPSRGLVETHLQFSFIIQLNNVLRNQTNTSAESYLLLPTR